MEPLTIFIRFFVVFLLSLIYGLQRQKSHKPIGFGAFILVSVGSCGLALISIAIQDNPLALLGAIVTGIGFLGAGALIRTTDKVFGFTTAASIWIFAIFGLIIGIGRYMEGLIIYSLIWVVILVDDILERRGIGSYKKKFTIYTNKIINLNTLSKIFPNGKKLISVNINKKDNQLIVSYFVEGPKNEINQLPNQIYNEPWFESCKIE